MSSTESFTKVGSLGRLYYVGSKQTWMEARNTCERMGSRLVELWNDEQYRQVMLFQKAYSWACRCESGCVIVSAQHVLRAARDSYIFNENYLR